MHEREGESGRRSVTLALLAFSCVSYHCDTCVHKSIRVIFQSVIYRKRRDIPVM